MEKLRLINPTEEYLDEIASYRKEFLEYDSSMDGCGPLRRCEDPKDWLKTVEDYSKIETLPENRVLSTQFIYVRESDNKIVGMIQVRHYFNDYLEKYAGHIGYSVRPTERRKGYAKRMLAETLPYCRELGLSKVLITCIDSNEASRKTILGGGGVYESTVYEPDEGVNLERYWIDLTK